MVGQAVGQLEAVELELDEIVGERPLVAVQHAVLVVVGESPHLGQHRVGQLGLDELGLGGGARYLAVGGVHGREGVVRRAPRSVHNPVVFAHAGVDAVHLADAERTGVVVEGARLDARRADLALVVLVGQHLHELRDVCGEHEVDPFHELLVQRLERLEVGHVEHFAHLGCEHNDT